MVLLNVDLVPAAMDSTVAAVHSKQAYVCHKHEHVMLMEKQKSNKCKYFSFSYPISLDNPSFRHCLLCICILENKGCC